jgi:hypothetical protein
MIDAQSHVDLEEIGDAEEKYVYDVYLYEETEESDEVLVTEVPEVQETDYSSNDEDNPDNDYPDEEDCDSDEYDYYRDYEDDETREMMSEFAKHCIDPDKLGNEDESSHSEGSLDLYN